MISEAWTGDPALEMTGISKTFHVLPVLDQVDFRVESGEVRALLGHNGAGKSTLMKIASGAVRPDAGRVMVAGRPVSYADPQSAHKLGLRMVYQELSLIPTLSVADNVFLGRELRRTRTLINGRRQRREVSELFDSLGIRVSPRRLVGELSIADRQMIEIAKAIRDRPAVLLLDEPTASLSNREIDRFFDLIRSTVALGTAIVLITHHLNEVFEICDAVSVLRDGVRVLDSQLTAVEMRDVIEAITGHAERRTRSAGTQAANSSSETGRPQEPLLAVKDLSVEGKFRNVSFDLRPHEVVGVVGLAGGGRSTLLKALVGEVPSTSRSIRTVEGRYNPKHPADAVARGIFMVPEDRRTQGLLLDHSISLNIVLGALRKVRRAGLLDNKKAEAMYASFRDRMNIRANSPTQAVGTLSGGNQQKVLLSRAFATDCRVLLLDEPTFGVDVGAADEICELVRDYVDKGNCAVWVSSDLIELARVADRVLILTNGSITMELDNRSHDLTEQDLLHYLHTNEMVESTVAGAD